VRAAEEQDTNGYNAQDRMWWHIVDRGKMKNPHSKSKKGVCYPNDGKKEPVENQTTREARVVGTSRLGSGGGPKKTLLTPV